MKAIHLLRMATFVVMLALALPASAAAVITPATEPARTARVEDARMQQLVSRLEEIRNMDISTLSKSERKALKKEVKNIKREIKGKKPVGGGIYLSVGAILVIILLLILLL